MKRLILLILLALSLTLSACSNSGTEEERKVDTSSPDESVDTGEDVKLDENTINIIVNNVTYTATLEDNSSAKDFLSKIPITLDMIELNGNEKYADLPYELLTEEKAVGNITSGELMLYGTNQLVLFYQDFETPNSYTPIAKIDDPAGLADNLGSGNVTVKFN